MFRGRFALLAVVVLLVLTTLVGCGGSSARLTVDTTAFNFDTPEEMEAHGLKSSELTAVAEMLASVYSSSYNSQVYLIAATRGYDMTVENFDDSQAAEDKGYNAEFVKSVLTHANDKAKAEDKIDVELFDRINELDVETLIDSFRVKVDTEAGGGLFDPILLWIGTALQWITKWLGFGYYLIGICVFAILVEILMLPFAIKQQKNSIRQAKLRPKEMAIRNKYRGRTDQVTMQKMQQEIQEFYQRENYSPYSGCLPLLIQLPIIMALYSIIIDPLHYVLGQASSISAALQTYCATAKAAGGAGMALSGNGGTIALLSDIKLGNISLEGLQDFALFSNSGEVFESLSSIVDKIPSFNAFGQNFGLVPSLTSFSILWLVPVLTFGAYFLTSKLNRKFMYQPATNEGADARQVACSNTMMDITMPAMSTVFTFMVPALVGVYWIFRSFVSLAKQFIVSRLMPLPKFTEEDYKAAAREMAGKKAPVKKSSNVGKVRSLHHIDDEDYEDTRDRALARKAAIEEHEREEKQAQAEESPVSAAPLKEERKNKKKKTEKREETAEQDAQADNEIDNKQE